MCVLAAAVASTACETSKSSNPLSPSVAGPIPGVNITAPKILEPAIGAKIPVDQQPVTLTVENASTSGVRPLVYVFEVAADAAFTNMVFTREGITPGDGGRTKLRLPDPLATGRSYFWRTRAQDGANTGDYSAANFDVFTPIIIETPTPTQPAANSTVTTLRPQFVVNNANKSGPFTAVTYTIEVADSFAFTNKVATWSTGEQSGQTKFDIPTDLKHNTVYYWHVRASDSTTTGPWSNTVAFQTFAAPPVPDPIPVPVPSGPVPGDAINLGQVAVYNSPADIASWPATSAITQIRMDPSMGLSFEFTKQNVWPNPIPPGFTGGIQYTVWAVVFINGRWHTSGFIEMWQGRPSTGAPILSDFARNWAYDGRWGPMAGYQPRVGEQMGFFLSAGDARGRGEPTSVRERTNVVIIALPAGDSGVFRF